MDRLPEEILLIIFRLLTFDDQVSVVQAFPWTRNLMAAVWKSKNDLLRFVYKTSQEQMDLVLEMVSETIEYLRIEDFRPSIMGHFVDKYLTHMRNLKELMFWRCDGFEIEHLKRIVELPQLRSLTLIINTTPPDMAAVTDIMSLGSIQDIELTDNVIGILSETVLNNSKYLRKIEISYKEDAKDCGNFERAIIACKCLDIVEIAFGFDGEGMWLSKKILETDAVLVNLQKLMICEQSFETFLRKFLNGQLPALREIRFYKTLITSQSDVLELLRESQQLEKIAFHVCDFQFDELAVPVDDVVRNRTKPLRIVLEYENLYNSPAYFNDYIEGSFPYPKIREIGENALLIVDMDEPEGFTSGFRIILKVSSS